MSGLPVLYKTDEAVATVTLNRPERLNAWTPELGTAYFDALDRAADDPSVRVIVVTGAGRGWCAGADMDILAGVRNADGERVDQPSEPDTRPTSYPTTIPKPIISAINGAAAGLGFVYATMTDLRFASETAKFTTSFAQRGLIAEHGVSWTLPRLIGQANALDLLLSGRVILAEEAKELGLVNRVFSPDDLLPETMKYARQLAAGSSSISMGVMKKQVYNHMDLDLDAALAESIELMYQSLQRDDFREGVSSFVDKRPPAFSPATRTTFEEL